MDEPICPRCGSDNIEDVVDYQDLNRADMFRCLNCDFTWEEHPPENEEEKL